MAAITRSVPDFGGMFVNEQKQTLYVYMQGGLARAAASRRGRRPAIERAVRLIAQRFQLRMPRVKVLRARYDFRQLDRWHRRLGHLLRMRGVVSTDVDERRNRIEIGVSSRAARRPVIRRLRRLRVPRRAVRIRRARIVQPTATLRDRRRPMVGGQMISTNQGNCTLGVFGYSWTQRRWGFITNSHCTQTMGTVEATRFYQPWAYGSPPRDAPANSDVSDAGTEVADATRNLSYSPPRIQADVAFAAVPSWADPDRGGGRYWDSIWSHGAIALPPVLGPGPFDDLTHPAMEYNGYTINPANGHPIGARWIVGVANPWVGMHVRKVGQRTGYSAGHVTHTCVNRQVRASANHPSYTVACAANAPYYNAQGDSGAPVFWGDPQGFVWLVGINYGGSAKTSDFSPMSEVEKVLGQLSVCRSGFERPGRC
ncbi:MAG: S1 family peptidase [Chloroflexota bacterium]|nr:S1 family peptidase [Chloroflexota bacterium]